MKHKKLDLIDLLGIGFREDSFTNILEYLFNNNIDFKSIF